MASISTDVRDGEAARLKQLYASFSRLSNREFGKEHGLGSAGMVWQYLNGHRPLNLEAATKFARALGVQIEEFSPRLAQIAASSATVSSAAAEAHSVAEPAKGYGTGWPFRTILREELARLTAEQIELLESVMRPIIDRALGTDSRKRKRA